MDCPSCRAPNADDAATCALCHAPFKAKPSSTAPKRLILEYVETHLGDRVFHGTVIAEPEGLYFFVDKEERRMGTAARLAAFFLGQSAGMIAGSMVEGAVQRFSQFESGSAAPAWYHSDKEPEIYQPRLSAAPSLMRCGRFFVIKPSQVESMSIPEEDTLVIRTEGHALEVRGDLQEDAISGYLRLWRYPMRESTRGLGKRFYFALVPAVLLIVGFWMEIREIQQLFEWVGNIPLVKEVFFSSDSHKIRIAAGWVISSLIILGIIIFGLKEMAGD